MSSNPYHGFKVFDLQDPAILYHYRMGVEHTLNRPLDQVPKEFAERMDWVVLQFKNEGIIPEQEQYSFITPPAKPS